MPLNKYFKGKGEEVMTNMKKECGAEKGTANKKKGLDTGPSKNMKKKHGVK